MAPNVVRLGCEGHKMLPAKKPTCLPLTLAFVALSLVSAEGAAAKCSPELAWPGLGLNDAVILVDGSVVLSGVEELDEMASDVHSIVIKCWNPATGEFQPRGGANVISVWTKGFVESTRAPIEALLRAQEAYFSQHSRYAQSLDDLVGFGVPRDAMLEFSATSEGWSAVTARDDVAYRCFVYSGNATQQLTDMKEHEVVCEPGASPVLREIYESLVRFHDELESASWGLTPTLSDVIQYRVELLQRVQEAQELQEERGPRPR